LVGALCSAVCSAVCMVLDTTNAAVIFIVTTFDSIVYYIGEKIADFLDIFCAGVSAVFVMTKIACCPSREGVNGKHRRKKVHWPRGFSFSMISTVDSHDNYVSDWRERASAARAEKYNELMSFPQRADGFIPAEYYEWLYSERAVKIARGNLAGVCGFAVDSDHDTVTVLCIAILQVRCNRKFVIRREDIEDGFYGHPDYYADANEEQQPIVQEQIQQAEDDVTATTDDGVVDDDGVVIAESPETIMIVGGKYIGMECVIKRRLAVKVRIELVETGKVVDIMSTSLDGVEPTTSPRTTAPKVLRRSLRIQNMRARTCSLRRSPRLNKV